ncbi:uncharacterized protein LY89DRAFT_786073 [Mollisia scopiformis]|uniref:Uncharacterized protein n=1 Tax=Mollisia scopiformis TaxID=149040 RepID=A0A194WVB1_MOLSC|nr:uncharacterized protein LY89DRAFT_786073 [Mollisia scopiformis]KUJ11906.1 hypothetical protein LY89DRAFT_786073 [Mollisia scopiformis]
MFSALEIYQRWHARAIATLPDQIVQIPQISDGYGDFSFFCVSKGCSQCVGRRIVSSPDLASEESPTHTRRAFRFLDLPRDVRDMIYDYIVDPFRLKCRNDRIEVSIRPTWGGRCHPLRDGYTLRIIDSKYPDMIYDHGKHPLIFRAVISLAQVNHQIRTEIGHFFWKNTVLSASGEEGQCLLMIDLLRDRPAIHRGIKSLILSWTCGEGPMSLNDHVPEFCEYLAKHLALDEIQLEIWTTPSTAREIIELQESIAWVQAFRKITRKELTFALYLSNAEDLQLELEMDFNSGWHSEYESVDLTNGSNSNDSGSADGAEDGIDSAHYSTDIPSEVDFEEGTTQLTSGDQTNSHESEREDDGNEDSVSIQESESEDSEREDNDIDEDILSIQGSESNDDLRSDLQEGMRVALSAPPETSTEAVYLRSRLSSLAPRPQG